MPARRTAFSYRAEFVTRKSEWIDVRVPISDFRVTSIRRSVPGAVNAIGFLLGEKTPGPFRLEVESIGVER